MDPNRSSESAPEARFESAVPLDLLPLHSTNLLTVLDEHGIVRYESPSIERIYGFDQEALVGDNVAEYFHPDDRADVVSAFRTVVTSEEYTAEAVEYRHRQADGTYLWVESVASANPTPEGYYVVNTRDISDRKRREQHLQHANERLEAFVSVVSHDLRNPLSVAEGRLRLAQTECECDHLDDVANAHARMDALIEDLLSRAQTDRPLA
ncbi:MAG: PAS domain S-box protein, partial [Natrialbaceae archaeon]